MLTPSQISGIVKNSSGKLIEDKKYHDKLKFLITGNSKNAQLEIIMGFESKVIKDIREKYSTPINWLWEWILSPTNKVFSANGGSIIIEDSTEDKKAEILEKASALKTGLSLRDWMQKYWMENYITDPAGVVLMEYDSEDTWPMFYSIDEIISYQKTGRFVDWIIFQPFKGIVGSKIVDIYRVYDDTIDASYIKRGEDFFEIASYIDVNTREEKKGSFPINPQFSRINGRKVPGFVIGDIPDNNVGPKKKVNLSLIDKQVKLGVEYYQLDTIRVFVSIKNGYGTYYWYTRPCKKCNGSGWLDEENHKGCPDCGGAGRIYPKNVNDIYLIDVGDEEKITTPPGGIIEGDTTGWKQYIDQLTIKGKDIEKSFWGTNRAENGSSQTATGVFADLDSATDRLNNISMSAENAESIIFRYIGAFHSSTFKKGVSTYGRRYMFEKADALWDKYQKARNTGAPETVLNKMLIEYYESEYRNDSMTRNRMIKLLSVEPFPHLPIDKVMSLDIPFEQKQSKIYFSEWESQQQTTDILNKKIDILIKELSEYSLKKNPDGKKE